VVNAFWGQFPNSFPFSELNGTDVETTMQRERNLETEGLDRGHGPHGHGKMAYMVCTSGTGQCEEDYSTRIGNAHVWILIGAAQRSLCRLESLQCAAAYSIGSELGHVSDIVSSWCELISFVAAGWRVLRRWARRVGYCQWACWVAH